MTSIRADLVLSQSAFSHVVDVPFDAIDIASWLFALPDAEYQRCAPPDHIAAGATWTDDGRRMSINVEQIGTGLVVQHYVGEITEKNYCRMVSLSDVFTPHGRTKVQVIWELSAKQLADGKTEYTNSVIRIRPTISSPLSRKWVFLSNRPRAIARARRAIITGERPPLC
ncbi:hypothetical protein [Paraburkholderia caribensis]|uniref:hypothetical protein n=1 Tax=Paraburkholderia caribensis TaxID=75105 RepID=UPI001D07BF50|nr:hypothetical protein [Paraburkholderia caribensis]